MDDIQNAIKHTTKHTLVIFDIDNTLVVPNDMILRPPGSDLLHAWTYQCSIDEGIQKLRHLGSLLILQRKISLVENEILNLIQNLQKQDVKVIALTAMRTGEFGIIPSMEDWRHNELKGVGIDFSSAFPKQTYIVFHELNEFDIIPTFKHGIIASGAHSKGEVLAAFLKKIKWLPDKVIFIDDHMECVESVRSSLESLRIEYIGIHYVAPHIQLGEVDEQIAQLQFNYLMDYEIWLSDAEAKKMLGI